MKELDKHHFTCPTVSGVLYSLYNSFCCSGLGHYWPGGYRGWMQSDKKKDWPPSSPYLIHSQFRDISGNRLDFIRFSEYIFVIINFLTRSILVSFSMIENCWCCVDQVFIYLVNISSVAWGFFSYIYLYWFFMAFQGEQTLTHA